MEGVVVLAGVAGCACGALVEKKANKHCCCKKRKKLGCYGGGGRYSSLKRSLIPPILGARKL